MTTMAMPMRLCQSIETYSKLTSSIHRKMTIGSAMRITAESRPSADSARTCRNSASRSRSVVAVVRSVSPRLPPTLRWIWMAMAAQRMFLLSIRSAMRSRASSMSDPMRVSAMARENSLAAGWATSCATASRACGREKPVDRLLATSVSTSGSCRSNLRARRSAR